MSTFSAFSIRSDGQGNDCQTVDMMGEREDVFWSRGHSNCGAAQVLGNTVSWYM